MPITFIPDPGTVLWCHFDRAFRVPEMVKKRLVVVISHRSRIGPGLATVVPISATPPIQPKDWHCLLSEQSIPPQMRNEDGHWVKGDMLYTLSLSRLDRIYYKPFGGDRVVVEWAVTADDLARIRECVAYALHLTPEPEAAILDPCP